MIDIDKAFEGRWRLKNKIITEFGNWHVGGNPVDMMERIKSLCRDFFEAGLILGSREYVPLEKSKINIEKPTSAEECFNAPPPCRIKESDILTVEDTFNKWWDLYDLKCGKENCMKKWKKLTAKEQFDCIKATPAYVASTPDKQFRKRPLTYLNQKAWNDEIINRNGTDKQSQRNQRFAEVAGRIAEYTKDSE